MVVEIKPTITQNGILGSEKQKATKDQLLVVKGNNFPEVTFCNVSNTTSSLGTIREEQMKEKKSRKKQINNDIDLADSISSSNEKKKPVIPDGGYGWVVVFSSLTLSLIADGIAFSFGLIYTQLLAYFPDSKSKTAWIGSLFLAVPLLVGPIMSNLVDKYGCRKMTIIGGILSGLGFALSSICNSVEALYITFGIISGLGLGIGYVTAVVSIAFWFDKNRTFATSIGAAGTGIGTFIYAPFTNWLIEKYDWRGATLILAGTLLNTCVSGSLMRDPDWLIEENRLESRSQSVTTFSNSSVCLDEVKKLLETGAPKETVLDTLVTNCNTEANQMIMDPHNVSTSKKYRSELFLPTYLHSQDLGSFDGRRQESRRSLRHKNTTSRENLIATESTEKVTTQPKEKYLASVETLSPSEKETEGHVTPFKTSLASFLSTGDADHTTNNHQHHHHRGSRFSLNENLMNKCSESISDLRRNVRGNSLDILRESDIYHHHHEHATLLNNGRNGGVITIPEGDFTNHFHHHHHHHHNHEHENFIKKKKHELMGNAFRRNISIRNSNYFKDMRLHRNSIHYRGALMNTHRYRLRASSCPNIYRNSMTTIAREEEEKWYDNFVDIMKSMFDFSLFLDPKFTLFNLSTLLLFIWFIIPYFYVTEHMLAYNYKEEDSAILISIIGIFSTIGMLVLGYIGDKPWLNISKTYAYCLVLCGLSVALIPLVIEYYSALIALCVIFGLTFASTFSFTPSILVSIVDLEDFTCAYGLVLLVQGIGSLFGPPLAAFIYDITLRWDDSFYASGFFISLSGVLAYLVAVLEDREEREKDIESKT